MKKVMILIDGLLFTTIDAICEAQAIAKMMGEVQNVTPKLNYYYPFETKKDLRNSMFAIVKE